MKVPVLVEPIEGGRFRAKAGEPFACCAEGETKRAAFANLEQMIHARLRAGAYLLTLDLTPADPRVLWTGILKPDDPLVEEWKEAMAENRREEEGIPDPP
jgi:predicted RNase H-like HicB family nuclease